MSPHRNFHTYTIKGSGRYGEYLLSCAASICEVSLAGATIIVQIHCLFCALPTNLEVSVIKLHLVAALAILT
jgi:hypothetical protein